MTFEFANSTIMSVLYGVAHQDATQRRSQLERFALQYTQPLVAFLCRAKRISQEQAEEIVQSFWLHKLILPPPEQTIVAKFIDKVRRSGAMRAGSFRRYLMRAVANHFLDGMRRDKYTPASLEAMVGFDVVSELDRQTFDAAWANAILRSCVNGVREECLGNGQESMWSFLRANRFA